MTKKRSVGTWMHVPQPAPFGIFSRLIAAAGLFALSAAALCADGTQARVAEAGAPLEHYESVFKYQGRSWRLQLPVGHQLERLAAMDNPRMITFDDDGVLLAGSASGRIYKVHPPYETARVLARLRGHPGSVALHNGHLLVAKTDGVYRARYRPLSDTRLSGADFTRITPLPTGGHSSRTLGIGPDNRVYLSIGISSNCSDQYIGADYAWKHRRGGVMVRSERDGDARWEAYASGLRNPIGFDWHPDTGVLYASNSGPDHHGYDLPPEYFSRLDAGSFHGMPWFWFDGEEMVRDRCVRSTPPRTDAALPVATFPARNAPMDVAFVPRDALDPAWAGDAVVALHGSWATQPDGGYFGDDGSRRPPWVALVRFGGRAGKQAGALRVEPLVAGFQRPDGKRLARPVGVAFGPDGALYFTSDGGEIEGLFRLR